MADSKEDDMNILDISPMWAVLATGYTVLLTMWYINSPGGDKHE